MAITRASTPAVDIPRRAQNPFTTAFCDIRHRARQRAGARLKALPQFKHSYRATHVASLCLPKPFKSYLSADGASQEAEALLLNDRRARSEGGWPLYSFKQLNLSQPEQSSASTCEPELTATFACIMCRKDFFIMFTSIFPPSEITEGQIWFSNQF